MEPPAGPRSPVSASPAPRSADGSTSGLDKPLLRRLGSAAVVFDPVTWQTHVLPPAAAVVADFIAELSVAGPVSVTRIGEALREELELDPDHPEMRELLRRLAEIGLLDT